jgi:hypothetical protein
MDYSLLIGGLGIGSLLTSAVSHMLNRGAAIRDRLYAEKRETFIGLLDALREASLAPSPAASKAYGFWQARCELFASSDVAKYARDLMDTPPKDRERHYESLIDAMKKDLRHHA